jgi:hypothetical protein
MGYNIQVDQAILARLRNLRLTDIDVVGNTSRARPAYMTSSSIRKSDCCLCTPEPSDLLGSTAKSFELPSKRIGKSILMPSRFLTWRSTETWRG